MDIIKKKHYFNAGNGAIKSGSYEASLKTYKKVDGKSGKTWLIPINLDPSSIHVDIHDSNSKGYAGSILSFDLDTGDTYEVKGPWNSNPEALFQDTKIDLRNKHKTYGIIALKRNSPPKGSFHMNYTYEDVLYLDKQKIEGTFNRIDDLAQKFADKLDTRVFYQVVTAGGGCAGSQTPNKKTSK